MKTPYRWALAMSMLSVAAGAGASPPPGHGPREPPPFAFEACSGKSEGADCSVSFHDRTLGGTCATFTDRRLFCLPNDVPPPPPDHDE